MLGRLRAESSGAPSPGFQDWADSLIFGRDPDGRHGGEAPWHILDRRRAARCGAGVMPQHGTINDLEPPAVCRNCARLALASGRR